MSIMPLYFNCYPQFGVKLLGPGVVALPRRTNRQATIKVIFTHLDNLKELRMNQTDRRQVALQTIKDSQGTPYWEHGVKPFITHQLEVVDSSYWQHELGTSNPSYSDVLELVMYKTSMDNGLTLDFTLPENITTYVIRVRFDGNDQIIEITTVVN